MADPIGASKELLGRLTNRLCKNNSDKPDDNKNDDSGRDENDAHVLVAAEHWLYRVRRNALVFGEAAIGDALTLSAAGFRATREAAGNLRTGMMSKATGFWYNNNDVNVAKDKPDGPDDAKSSVDSGADGAQSGLAGEHWLYRNRRKILIYGGAAAAGAGAVAATPLVLAAAGFGPAGIAAGSVGASIMSKAATTGIGMGVVSTLQSAGAAGIAGSTSLLIGGGVTAGVVKVAGESGESGNKDKVVTNPPKLDNATSTETTPAAEKPTEKKKLPTSKL